jgi:hypothetical protein
MTCVFMPQFIVISLVELYGVLVGSSGSELDAGQELCYFSDMNDLHSISLSKAAAKS